MRVGVSFDLERFDGVARAWQDVVAEIEQADKMGFESAWIHEGRAHANHVPAPDLFLTYVARRTRSIQLRAGRCVTRANPVRIAEQIAVLDTFSRGRAGLFFASGASQSVPAQHVHETLEFVRAAWMLDEMRYRGDYVRFPAHTPDDAPAGASEPEQAGEYVPQWDWGPITPDFLAVTPKPYATQPPLSLDISEDASLEWAAQNGVSPMLGADLATDAAVERLARYREVADKAGRKRHEVEAVLERRLDLDGPGDASTLGGPPRKIVEAIRAIRAETYISHFVWRRSGVNPMDLFRFASEVQTLLQA